VSIGGQRFKAHRLLQKIAFCKKVGLAWPM
jgi:hypothetical protein